ncbi:MAG: hypothetical protein LBJ21_02785 [Acidobacteriota bacterium]|jgi:hypothetical protein|nr:hypothetical protein [Acidobacteriota bacterium]
MRKSKPVAAAMLLIVIVACAAMTACTPAAQSAAEYEVMNPWADVDPIPLRGISPRIDTLEGKKVGVFANFKRSAVPQARMVERKLKEKFPTIQTDLYHSREANVNEAETANREKFIAWIKSVDAVVATVGD